MIIRKIRLLYCAIFKICRRPPKNFVLLGDDDNDKQAAYNILLKFRLVKNKFLPCMKENKTKTNRGR